MPSKLYWSTWPRSRMKERVQRAVANGEIPAEEAEAEPAYGTLDAHITTVIDVTAHVDQKFEAILAHVTQIRADSWVRQMSPDDRLRGFGSETFVPGVLLGRWAGRRARPLRRLALTDAGMIAP